MNPHSAFRSRLVLVPLAMLLAAPPATAAETATLELSHGPDDTGALRLKALRATLDGRDLQIATPASGAEAAAVLFTGPLAPGMHKLAVEADLAGEAAVFTYMDGYRVKMSTQLDLEVLAGEGVAIRSRILPQSSMTAKWEDRYRLVLTLTSSEGGTVVASSAPPPAPPSEGAASAKPAPEAASPPPPAPAAEPARAPEPQAVAESAPTPQRAPQPVAESAPPPQRAPQPVAESAPPPRRAPQPVAQPAPAAGPRVARAAEPTPAPAPASARAPAPEPAPEPRLPRAPRTAALAPAAAQGDCALGPIHFAFDRSTLSAEAREALDRLAGCLAERSVPVRVVGHCDPRGRLEYNRWLAWDRAAAVAGYLREHGVAHGRVSTHFADAVDCPEATEACFAGQRRVEVLLREPPAPSGR